MKSRLKVFCFILAISIATQIFGVVFAEQASSTSQQLFPIWNLQKNGTRLCGFINQSGKIIIKPKYTVVYPFSDGVAWVSNTPVSSVGGTSHKWQLIDTTGKVLFENSYIDKPSQFKDGVCQVETTTKVGNTSTKNKVYINKKGTVLFIKPATDDVGPISQDLLLFASRDQYGLTYSKYGFIDKNGNSVIEQKYVKASSFSEGLAAVSIYDENGKIKAGFIDQKGNEVIKFKYDSAGDFINGYAPIAVINDFFSVSNKGVLNIEYDFTYFNDSFPLSSAMFIRKIINTNKPIFAGSALYGFINKNGETIIEPQYTQIQYFQEGYSAVCKNDSWGFINAKNNKLTDFVFSDARSFKQGFAAVLVADDFGVNKWGFIDKKGKIAILPKFDEVGDFNNGLAAVKINGKWGFINSKGAYVVKPTYKMATDFSNGLALATYDVKAKPVDQGWAAYINASGKVVWKSHI